MQKKFAHVMGFDDAPFEHAHRGDVMLVGTVYCNLRLEGVLSGKVRRDGRNSTQTIINTVRGSRFYPHIQLIMLQGIAVAGFNVIDIHMVYDNLGIPVLVVCRKQPNLQKIHRALLEHVPGGAHKWRLIEQAGPMQPVAGVFVQSAGIGLPAIRAVLQRFCVNSSLPEPLRTAHLIAGGVTLGESKHRA